MKLLVFGPGYAASAAIARLRDRSDRVTVTARSPEAAAEWEGRGVQTVAFDGNAPSGELAGAIAGATHILLSIPPGDAGDPVLAMAGDAIAAAPRLEIIVYLSTVGVYGDHGGAWVDEETVPDPASRRSVARLEAERGWQWLAQMAGKPLAILRLGGIYGPGRNALANLADGTARRLVKPGQVFNRIHVGDIAAAIDAAFARKAEGVFNVVDDEPAAAQDVVAYAAGLMAVTPPPEIPFAEAELTPMARSFYGENKRVRNRKLKQMLGLEFAYPTYREGLAALWQSGEGGAQA